MPSRHPHQRPPAESPIHLHRPAAVEVSLLDPVLLELPEQYQDLPPELIEWAKIRRNVSRLSMRDLTAAIIPTLHDHHGKVPNHRIACSIER
ncbi:hypothetical protein BN873_10018 [Candidatus Competibacter denitrificans Run_A_D11]|uniref:Uncharacterized protein n=1 Tax=Candidatus Competibacter denitrificans Run_A_D11 TaxID=1400863 RepID=W6M011_9GAMM|nr:hypothetical protein [Candidatus Competibacter denitrificans]CDI00762.1 hypothetical protein BN873_10018 [Candidatus Competibacter denitrificans Run_A_D11]